MNKKIVKITLQDLKDKIGTHEFEIIDISTNWCGPCQAMKKSMEKIFTLKDFKNVDLQVYVLDGDVCSSISGDFMVAKAIKEKKKDFPMKRQDFLNLLEEILPDDHEERELVFMMNAICDVEFFEKKDGEIYMNTSDFDDNTFNPYIEFEVNAYPTLIFYHNGDPIKSPLNEDDYESRGFEYYDKKIHEKIENPVIEEMKERGKKVKIIQLNKKMDARMVGFEKATFSGTLKKFIQM